MLSLNSPSKHNLQQKAAFCLINLITYLNAILSVWKIPKSSSSPNSFVFSLIYLGRTSFSVPFLPCICVHTSPNCDVLKFLTLMSSNMLYKYKCKYKYNVRVIIYIYMYIYINLSQKTAIFHFFSPVIIQVLGSWQVSVRVVK